MVEGGVLSGSVGSLIGVGPGSGIALLFVVLGISVIVLTLATFSHPRLSRLEEEIRTRCPRGELPLPRRSSRWGRLEGDARPPRARLGGLPFFDGTFGVGFRRLSILDLESSDQP